SSSTSTRVTFSRRTCRSGSKPRWSARRSTCTAGCGTAIRRPSPPTSISATWWWRARLPSASCGCTPVAQSRRGPSRARVPGGSITGAPKVRAMQIIAELEPTQRAAYCGSIGYLSLSGAADTSIVIRTCLVLGSDVYFQVGGGIVADSDPALEYRETLDKARGLIAALVPC